LSEGESLRKKLSEAGLLDYTLLILKEGGNLILPLKREEPAIIDLLKEILPEPLIEERDLPEAKESVRSYRDLLEVPQTLEPLLPTAFDVVGKVAVVKFHDELLRYRKDIGEAMLKAHSNFRTVAADAGVTGDLRIRHLEVVAGEPSLETTHTESGLKLQVDIGKVYFSPRLATERLRVAKDVRENENVCDLFAGVGPFSLQVAKMHPECSVTACDVNPDAFHFLKRNIEMNGLSNVTPFLGDAKELIPTLPPQDRFIMNLPHSSFDFIPYVLTRSKVGTKVNYYEILENEAVPNRKDTLLKEAKKAGLDLSFLSLRQVKTYSASSSMMSFDIKIARSQSHQV